MANVNRCTFIGTVGKDPEVKFLPSGDAACNLSIAINNKWKDKKTNEVKESTDWVPLDFFGKVAEIAGKYLKKGSSIYVEGQYKTRKYEKDGKDAYATSIRVDTLQMLDKKGDGVASASGRASSAALDEDVPF